MASSRSKALWDTLSLEQKKEIGAIAAGWQVGQQTTTGDTPMEDETAPPSSSVHADLTIDESGAHYTDMLREEEEAKFRQTLPTRPTTSASLRSTGVRRSCSPPAHPSCLTWTCPSRRRCSSPTTLPARFAANADGIANVRRS